MSTFRRDGRGRPISKPRPRPASSRRAYRAAIREQRDQVFDQRAAARSAESFRWSYRNSSLHHPDRCFQPSLAINGVQKALGVSYAVAEELALGATRIITLHALAECAQLPIPDGPAQRRRARLAREAAGR